MQRKRREEGALSGVLSKALLFLIVLLIVILGLIAYKVFTGRGDASTSQEEQSDELSEDQIVDLLGRVARHIKLPDEQDPLIATINDADALRSEQGFYRDVENGDQLIIFAKRAMAVIYRPSEDVLVNVGPIFSDKNSKPQQEPAAEVVQPAEAVVPDPSGEIEQE